MKCSRLAWVFLCLVPGFAWANGGPFDLSDVEQTGNIKLKANNAIRLDKETLQVKLDGDFADVAVEYHFINTGAAQSVDYGFPVEVKAFDTTDMWEGLTKKLKDTVADFA